MKTVDDSISARKAFDDLTEAEKRRAVCELIDAGMTEYGAAAATGLSVEQIRVILAERRGA